MRHSQDMKSTRRLGLTVLSVASLVVTSLSVGCAASGDAAPPAVDDSVLSRGRGGNVHWPTTPAPKTDAGAPLSPAGSSCAPDAPFVGSSAVVGGDTRSAALRSDELELFVVTRDGALDHFARPTAGAAFAPSTPIALAGITDATTLGPKVTGVGLSEDGLSLYVTAPQADARPPVSTLYVAHRAALSAAFGTPAQQDLHVEISLTLTSPVPDADESTLYYTVLGGGGARILRRALVSGTPQSPFAAPPAFTNGSVLSHDGLRLYTAVGQVPEHSGAKNGMFALALASRDDASASFGAPVNVTSLPHTDGIDEVPLWLSPDECRLYYFRGTFSSGELRVATK